jgi:hypothetical protein
LLLLQDFSRWTGTHGAMTSSVLHGAESPEMDVVTLAKGKNTSETCTRKKEECFPWRHPSKPRPRGIMLFHLDVDLWEPMTSPS